MRRGLSSSPDDESRARLFQSIRLCRPRAATVQATTNENHPTNEEHTMTISPVNVQSDVSISAYTDPQGLTAESLVIFLSAKLQNIDGILDSFMKEQQANIARKNEMMKYRQMLTDMKNSNSQEETDRLGQAYGEHWAGLPAGSVEAQQAEANDLDFRANIGCVEKQTDEFWDAQIARIDDQISSLDKNMELSMIRINQMMAQRQTAVQLATNIMKKHEDGISSIVQNLR